mmetsp:Transcript_17399/g.37598  ORF Transcript_17399/g.37598 Transcript_17399/m.37598 type:complete len:296 (-) Transcript_17399:181-1068(-)
MLAIQMATSQALLHLSLKAVPSPASLPLHFALRVGSKRTVCVCSMSQDLEEDDVIAAQHNMQRTLQLSMEDLRCSRPNMRAPQTAAAAEQQPQQPSPSRDPLELQSAFQLPAACYHRPSHARNNRLMRMRGAYMSAPSEALADIVVGDIASTDDERLWVPQTECLSFRPLCLCVSQGYYVNLLRFQGGGTLGCHRHSSPVHAHTIKGSWGYKEHAWTATAGTYVFEPPGETHTLVVHGIDEMIALFHVTGALLYCDPAQPEVVTGFDDVFTKLEKAKQHYEEVGLGAEFVQQFVR